MTSRRFRYTLLDVFTDTALAGNALAVVHDADGLDDDTMLRLARETRLSETTFVQRALDGFADYRNRIWTVAGEVPFAGHPSLGTAVAVALARGESQARYQQQTGVGMQRVDVERDGARAHASMTQSEASFGDEADPAEALATLGLAASDQHPDLPPQVVSTGLPTLIVPVSKDDSITRATPDLAAVQALLARLGAESLYLAWPDPAGEHVHARMFSSLVLGGEDPATGSAAGPLCAYLSQRLDWSRIAVRQGAEIGRPSLIEAEMSADGVRVGGDVVVLVDGMLTL